MGSELSDDGEDGKGEGVLVVSRRIEMGDGDGKEVWERKCWFWICVKGKILFLGSYCVYFNVLVYMIDSYFIGIVFCVYWFWCFFW